MKATPKSCVYSCVVSNAIKMVLNETILIETAKKSLKNAKDLLDEAQLLKVNDRICRAYTLFQICIEEVGKALMCHLSIIDESFKDKEKNKQFKKDFLSHTTKTDKSGVMNLIIAEVYFKGNYQGALDFINDSINEGERLNEINNFKNYSLYTSIIGNKVQNPEEIIDASKLKEIEFKALTRYQAANAFISIGIKALPQIRQFIKDNPNYTYNPQKHAEEFWGKILS